MKTILIACTADICRSPMAVAILRRRIAELGLGDQIACLRPACGPKKGHGASPNAVTTLAGRGMDLTGHRPRLRHAALVGRS